MSYEEHTNDEGFTPLMASIINNDLTKFCKLLESDTINVQNKDKWTALMVASLDVKNHNIKFFEKLIKYGSLPNLVNKEKKSALYLLLESAEDIDEYDEKNQKKLYKIVKMMLKNGADPNLIDKNGETSLIIASGSINGIDLMLKIFKILLKAKADPNIGFGKDCCLMHYLCEMYNDPEFFNIDDAEKIIKLLIDLRYKSIHPNCLPKDFLVYYEQKKNKHYSKKINKRLDNLEHRLEIISKRLDNLEGIK
jgi:ankyrin repeat protein